MHGEATLHSVDVIKNWLFCPSSSESLDEVMENMDDDGTKVGA